ncbi:hypothetical protein POM88_010881 [Heracleum sosnowskyi]|uniref:Nucleolus and neural progenitor protein-like N-terminal domain-containing protein n=1 Tax=Heracleum sosnowskyi TaxID=360622 RepID=A0AAD8IXD7_9APIA|nr:hypothetical protein POM88_010881 [Heracleum sosnowskyi]
MGSVGTECELIRSEPDVENIETRLKCFLEKLQLESRILDKIVYKNKNQHKHCLYFPLLLKIKSDLRLLHSAGLEEILSTLFEFIKERRSKQKLQLLGRLKRKKRDEKHNLLERLLGAARLLSQIVEPVLKAATQISILLAQSFFTNFSLTITALLARLRALVQQILLDIVIVFNAASCLSIKGQSDELTQDGFEIYKDLYHTNEQVVYLNCGGVATELKHQRFLERIYGYFLLVDIGI